MDKLTLIFSLNRRRLCKFPLPLGCIPPVLLNHSARVPKDQTAGGCSDTGDISAKKADASKLLAALQLKIFRGGLNGVLFRAGEGDKDGFLLPDEEDLDLLQFNKNDIY